MMKSKEELEQGLENIELKYGSFFSDIPLPFNVWTRGNRKVAHTRLKRLVQVVSDLTGKPLNQCRILDLGCLEGLFSIEFAKKGAYTIGVEIREANIKKAIFCKEVLGLSNLEFRQDDVRNITQEFYGRFDAIICSGILYHLPAKDAINLINRMYEIVDSLVVIDTHIALKTDEVIVYQGEEYWGTRFQEHSDTASEEEKEKNLWASIDNPTSFWFSRPSLINLLGKAGFSSVYECFNPPHINFGRPGLEHRDRCTFVALKRQRCSLETSPAANELSENWPNDSLSYPFEDMPQDNSVSIYRKVINKIKKITKKI